MLRSLLQFWRYLPAIAWLAVVACGAYWFIDLSQVGDFATDGTRRSWADKAFPYLFVLLIPLGLKCAADEYYEARDKMPSATAEAEAVRKKQRQHMALASADRFPLDPDMRRGLLETLNTLRAGGVVIADEVRDDEFLAVAETLFLEDSDLQGTAMVLGVYAEVYGALANACVFPVVAKIPDSVVAGMIRGFAALARRDAGLGPVTFSRGASGPHKSVAHFTLDDTDQMIPFSRPLREPELLYQSIAACFPVDPPFAVADLDSTTLLTRLADAELAKLNSEFDPDFGTFRRLGHAMFTSGTPST